MWDRDEINCSGRECVFMEIKGYVMQETGLSDVKWLTISDDHLHQLFITRMHKVTFFRIL